MNQQEQMFAFAEQWQESGLLKNKFCREHDISVCRFNYWLKKFNRIAKTKQPKPEVSFFSVGENPKKEKIHPEPKFTDRKTMRIDLRGGITITIY
jgi:hypothetical protein